MSLLSVQGEEEDVEDINQLIIDEITTSLVISKKKDEKSISRPYKKVFTVPTKSFCRKLDKSLSTNSILPKNTRYFTSDRKKSIVVLEEDPQVRLIRVTDDFSSVIENLKITGILQEFGDINIETDAAGHCIFNLSFPYMVYIVELFQYPHHPEKRLSVFYRTSPLVSLQDSLYKCNLLNIAGDNTCCFGDLAFSSKADLSTKVNSIIDSFWSNIFNRDIIENYRAYSNHPHLSTFIHWQYYSKRDPLFILSEDLIPTGNTLNSAITTLEHYDNPNHLNFGDSHRSVLDILSSDEKTWTEDEKNNLYSVTQMPLTKTGITLDSGEEIKIGEKKLYVVDFLKSEKEFLTLRAENEKTEIEDIPLSNEIISYLAKQITSKKYISSITIKDQVVKPGKVIKFNDTGYTALVRKIFKDRDKNILTKCGKDFYMLKNVNFTTFDEDNLIVNGLKLDKKKKYFVVLSGEYFPNFYKLDSASANYYQGFSHIDDDDDGDNMFLKFGELTFVPFDDRRDYNIFEEGQLEKLPIARYGQKLIGDCMRVRGLGLFARSSKDSLTTSLIADSLIDNVLKNQELIIPSYDFDIKFSVGDKVVIPDWSRYEPITEIRTITDFEVSPNKDGIDIVTTGPLQPFLKSRYISFRTTSTINTGSIRKISNEFDGIKAGFKIQAKIKGIQNFMKKDCYEVIGFLTDTANGIPLMLCSNLCTIWCIKDDLEKFEFIEPSSYKFNTLKLSPPTPVNPQPGDVICSARTSNRCCDVKVLQLFSKIPFSGGAYTVSRGTDGKFCRCHEIPLAPMFLYGIPNPRIKLDTKALMENENFVRVLPLTTYHNTFIDVTSRNYDNARVFVRREEISNVSNIFS